MKKIIVIILITISLLVIILSGCEELDKRFIGQWKPQRLEYPTFTFYSNKKYSIHGINGTWDIKDNMLVLKHGNTIEKYNFKFSGDNYVLTLSGIKEGIDRVYIKQS